MTDTDLRTALRRCMNCLEGSPDEEDVFHALNMGAAALQSEAPSGAGDELVESVALNIRNAGFLDTGFHVKGLDQIDPTAAHVYRRQARAAIETTSVSPHVGHLVGADCPVCGSKMINGRCVKTAVKGSQCRANARAALVKCPDCNPEDDVVLPKVKGGHWYGEDGTSDCGYGCGCYMGGLTSGGLVGVDPFGKCPKNRGAPIRGRG